MSLKPIRVACGHRYSANRAPIGTEGLSSAALSLGDADAPGSVPRSSESLFHPSRPAAPRVAAPMPTAAACFQPRPE